MSQKCAGTLVRYERGEGHVADRTGFGPLEPATVEAPAERPWWDSLRFEVFADVSVTPPATRRDGDSRMSSLIRSITHNSPRIQRTSVALVVLTSLAAFAVRASAQAPAISSGAFELRPYVGAFIPTGDQRDLLKDAVLVGGQASWRLAPALALTGTVGWTPSKDKISAGNQTLDIVQYDLGVEARAAGLTGGESWNFTPFAGVGLGGRTYSYRDLNVDSKTDFDGYGAVGGEFGLGRVGLRIEARDYVSRFKPLTGSGENTTRNDIALAAGLTIHIP